MTTVAEPIAIIGLACRFPAAPDAEAYWRLLEGGVDAITVVPRDRWDVDALHAAGTRTPGKITSRFGGFLEGVDRFDAAFFGITPREAVAMDPQQRVVLEVAWDALEDAGQVASALAGSVTGVFIGASTWDYNKIANTDVRFMEAHAATGTVLSILANRVSYALDLRGPSMAIDTACSSSLTAVHLACRSLLSGESSLALAGGVNLILSPETSIVLSQARMLAADGRCKAFDVRADGYVRSEGCGVVVLKRALDAQRDGDRILALIRGSAVNQDGLSNGLSAPNGPAQRDVLARALNAAGVAARDIGYVEAHGTGTAVGDPIEAAAIRQVLGPGRGPSDVCAIGSVKTNIGHTEAAAGMAGLIKVILALRHRRIPAQLHLTALNPNVAASLRGAPFHIARETATWPRSPGNPRRAGVSAFGFGGSNAHVVVEEAPEELVGAERMPTNEDVPSLLVLSARSAPALRSAAASMAAFLRERVGQGGPSFGDVCFTAAARRTHHRHRLAVAATSKDEAALHLDRWADEGQEVERPARRRPKTVFVLSGQGSQWLGMGRELAATEPVFAEAVARLEQAMRPYLTWSLSGALQGEMTEEQLGDPACVQPLLFAMQVALVALWSSWGVRPACVVGHSMGEVAAAHVSGALSLDDACRVICVRSSLVGRTRGSGGMLTVELGHEEAAHAIRDHAGLISVAASNGPRTTVLAGDSGALAALARELEAQGTFARPVKVDFASHSAAMDPVAEDLLSALAPVVAHPPTTRFASTTQLGPNVPTLDAAYWWENLRRPVLFAERVRDLLAEGFDTFLEISPHPVLLHALKDTLGAVDGPAHWEVVGSLRRGEGARRCLLDAVAALHRHGCPIELARLFPPGGRVVSLPGYPWQRERFWLDADDAGLDRGPSRVGRGAVAEPLPAPALHEQVWQADTAPRTPAPRRRWVVCSHADADALAQRLMRSLEEDGQRCTRVGLPTAIHEPDLTSTLWEDPEDTRVCPLGVVLVAGRAAAHGRDRSLGALLALVQTLMRHEWRDPPRLWIVTRGVWNAARTPAASGAALWGFAHTVNLELPELRCTLLDIGALDDAAADLVHDEVTRESGEARVVRRGEGESAERLVARLVGVTAPAPTSALAVRGTQVVTGGMGALGLAVAHWLVARGARELVLVGRHAPADAVAETIASLTSMGARVRTAALDVADLTACRALFSELAAEGPPVRGVFHLAGSLDDVAILNMTPAQLEGPVFTSKVVGAWNLDRVVRELELDAFVLFSSAAGVLGAAGAANYAAANAELDALARGRHAAGKPALSIAWGPWAGQGLVRGATREGRLAAQGMAGLSKEEGLTLLERAMALRQPNVVALKLVATALALPPPLARFLDRLVVPRGTDGTPAGASDGAAAALVLAAEEGRRQGLMEEIVGKAVGRVARLRPERVPRQETFHALGLDSLLVLELRHGVERDIGFHVSAVTVLSHPTVEQLARHLLTRISPPTAPRADVIDRGRHLPVRRSSRSREPIAIVGMACRFPGGASSLASFWEVLARGVDCTSDVPKSRWSADLHYDPERGKPGRTYTRRGGFLREDLGFDAGFFGISRSEAEVMDPQQGLLLETAWDALEEAGVPRERLATTSTGVFVGSASSDFRETVTGEVYRRDVANPYLSTGLAGSVLANRLSYFLDLHGPSVAVDTACSSSLVALHLACQSLRLGESDTALVAGVNLLLSPGAFIVFSQLQALAADGRCKTFDASADGYGRGEGCGVLVLQRQGDAQRDGNRVWAVVHGSAVNQDGRSSGLTVPNGLAQERLIHKALQDAGVSPAHLGYVEAHGTGTILGDPIEAMALAAVLRDGEGRRQPCALGSVKSNLGHLEAAAGVAGVIKAVLAIHHGQIPPSLHYERPNPHIPFADLPLRVQTELGPWPVSSHGRLAGVSAFGIGGTNAHAIVGEPPADAPAAGRAASAPDGSCTSAVALLVSAADPRALRQRAEAFAARLASATDAELRTICRAAAVRRSHLDRRLAVVATDPSALRARLELFLRDGAAPGAHSDVRRDPRPPLVFLFSGQGTQWAGMAQTLAVEQPVFRAALEDCDAVVGAHAPSRWSLLEELARSEASSRLADTSIAQPAIVALQIALARLFAHWGIVPDAVLGHSVGEIAAAHAAGALDLEGAMRLALERGRVMQKAAGCGGMAVVEATAAQLAPLLAAQAGQLSIAAVNDPASIVLSGETAPLRDMVARIQREGIRCRSLAVDYPFHSSRMAGAAEALAAQLTWIAPRRARLPMYSSVTGQKVEGPELTCAYWGHAVAAPVLFSDAMTALVAAGHEAFVEIGAHPALATHVERCLAALGRTAACLTTLRRGRPEPPTYLLLETAARLHGQGQAVDVDALTGGGACPAVDLPSYPWQHAAEAHAPATASLPDTPAAIARHLEATLARVLSDDVAERARSVSFFELGLDSLALITFRNALAAQLGLDIPIGALHAHDDVQKLAAFLARRRAGEASALAAPGSWFVRLSEPVPSAPRLRLYCFPPAGGGASLFRSWPRGLPASIELHALQLPGRETRADEPFAVSFGRTVDILAELIAVEDRPFALMGCSMGALLAYEVALALGARAQRPPRHLFVAASPDPGTLGELRRQVDEVAFFEGIVPAELRQSPVMGREMLAVLRADAHLAYDWTPPSFPPSRLACGISAFAGSHDPLAPSVEGWQRYTAAGFVARVVRGDHAFAQTNEQDLLGWVREDLDRIEE